MGLEDWAMKQDKGFGFGVGGVPEVKDVAVGPEAADDGGTGWSVNGLAECTDGNLAVVAAADAGWLAPDVRPPRTGGPGPEDGAFFGEGLWMGLVRGRAEFAMDFMLVGVGQKWVEPLVGGGAFGDAVGGEERDEAFLPVVVAAFDFAFGLWSGSAAEWDAVAVQGGAELGEGVGVVGVAAGVVVHIEGQWEAVRLKGAGEEVQVGQQGFGGVEACAGVEARRIVEDFQEDLFGGITGQEGVGRGVVWPERTVVAGLPAFDGLGRGFVARVGSELVSDGPAADAGTVGFKLETAVEFAGDGAVGGSGFGGEEFAGQRDGCRRPVRVMIAPGASG